MAGTLRVLCVGASGEFAGLVVPELVKRGVCVRALIRDPKEEDKVREKGASEVAVGDLGDKAALKAALSGVDRMFYIAPVFTKDEADLGRGVVEVAKAAGVKRFVFSSVIHPILGALANHVSKGPVEEAALSSGMEFTFLHPAIFFQNYAAGWPAVVKTGTLAEPYSAENRMSRVDYRDVAEVAAIALTEDRLVHGTFELCAPGELNRHEVAKIIGEVLGRDIQVATPSFDDWAEKAKAPEDPDQRKELKAMYDWYDRHELLGNPLTLTAILGHEPRSLKSYFEGLAKSDEGGGASD